MTRWAVALVLWGITMPVSADSLVEHDYILNCAGCHSTSGIGSATVPSLWEITAVVDRVGAREYLIRVPGAAQAPLTDARLATLMNWLVKGVTGSPPSPAYTAGEVRELRKAPLLDPLEARRRLLRAPLWARPTP